MKIVLLFPIFFITLLAFSSIEVVKLYEKNFTQEAILEVQKIDGAYIVLSSTIDFGRDEGRKLNLIAKDLLLKNLKKNDKKITAITLHSFLSTTQWKKDGRLYLLSYINQNQIESSYTPERKREQQSVIDEEIVFLEKVKDKNEIIHSQLKSLYFKKGDMDNYNRVIDVLMDIKFNGL